MTSPADGTPDSPSTSTGSDGPADATFLPVGSLKRFKDDVREVLAGLECGIGVDGVNGVQAGDLLEAFTTEEVARTL